MDEVITQEKLYRREIREMQKEINYLRHRVTELNDKIYDLENHTNKSIQYLEDSIEDYEGQGHA